MPGVKEKLLHLIKANGTPRGIALGVALGVFIATLPVYGLHTVMVILCAVIVPQANKLAILLGTNFSIPPTLPFITWAGYDMGRVILRKNYAPLNLEYFRHFNFKNIGDFYYPLFIGSLALGVVCAAIFYFVTLHCVKRIKEKRARAAEFNQEV